MKLTWSKGRVAAASALVLTAMAGVVVSVWGPGWARGVAIEQIQQATGRKATLESLDWSLWRMEVGLRGLTVYEADGRTVFVRVDQARAGLSWASLRYGAPVLDFVQMQGPQVHLARLDEQRWNYSDILARLAARPASPSKGEARFSLNNVALNGGKLVWEDRVTQVRHEVAELNVALPFISNLPYVAEQFTQPVITAKVDGSAFRLAGKTRPFASSHDADVQIRLDGLPLETFVPLSPVKVAAQLAQARLSTQLLLRFSQDHAGPHLTVSGDASLTDVRIDDAQGDALARWDALAVSLGASEPLKQRWMVQSVQWRKPELWVERNPGGRLPLLEAFVPGPAGGANQGKASAQPEGAKPAGSASASSALHWQLAQLAITDGAVHWVDADVPAHEPPRAQDISELNIQLAQLSMDRGQFGEAAVPVQVHARHNRQGRVEVEAQVWLPRQDRPLSAQGDLRVQDLELTAAQPYVADQLNVALTRGGIRAQGQWQLAMAANQAPQFQFTGQAAVQGLRSVDKIDGEDFIRWKQLGFKDVQIKLNHQAAGQHPLELGVGEISLDDFFARVIVKPNGRLNLQDILKTAQAEAAAQAAAQSANKPAKATGPAPRLAIGRIVMKGGRVDFADNFIKPNYAANLTDLNGTVSALASNKAQAADLNLRGRIDHDSPLSISGKVNPLAPKLYLQLAARATDIELTKLTPYSAKYASYPITKGKLSLDLKYLIDNGKLDAQNQVYVNQLTFGGKVDSPDAVKLPILFAIGLLTNSKGEMDVNLPISGTLSDPDFSVGGLVWRVVVNLVEKAVTAPFTLLASAFGQADELGYVAFEAGQTELNAAAQAKLDTLAKVLLDRPALKLELAGRVDPATELEGARKAYVASRVKAQKVADLVKQGQAANSEQIVVSPQEYPRYLERAYLAEPFDKPRNALGVVQTLPVPEMEKLMLQHALVDEMWLKSMADARALSAKRYLDEVRHVPVERLFLVASRLTAEGIADKGGPQRVDFSLAQ